MSKRKILLSNLVLIAFFYLLKNIISSNIKTGINQLNKFNYLDRLDIYDIQNKTKNCNIKDGPNCYYSENKYLQNLNNVTELDEWKNIYYKNNITTTFEDLYEELYSDISYYIQTYKDERDTFQNPPEQELILELTFDSYDELTKKNDILMEEVKSIDYYTDIVVLNIKGTLRLKYRTTNEKIYVQNKMDYPTSTFGTIESSYLEIKFNDKLFECKFFFVRPINKESAAKKFDVKGMNGPIIVFNSSFRFESIGLGWYKIALPGMFITSLIIPGGYDVDNFSFSIKSNNQYNIIPKLDQGPENMVIELVKDEDI